MHVKAGEVQSLELEFDWTRKDISKDFSVVVWSTEAKVEIEHDRQHWKETKLYSQSFKSLPEK